MIGLTFRASATAKPEGCTSVLHRRRGRLADWARQQKKDKTMTTELTNAQLIAGALGSMLSMRRLIELTDRNDPDQVAGTLDAIHEFAAMAGGSIALVADNMQITPEVQRLIQEGHDRLNGMIASSGLTGRA